MLDGIPLANLTPAVLLGIAVLLILLGRLVPKSTLDKETAEKEKWRQAYETEREARAISDAQTAELLELSKTADKILTALFDTTERSRHPGGADVALPTK